METGADKMESQTSPANMPAKPNNALHGIRLWVVIGGMMLGVYLVGLDLTMLSTVYSYPRHRPKLESAVEHG